jgi:hypothetical protein
VAQLIQKLRETKWSRLYTVMERKGSVTSLWRIKMYDSGPGLLSKRTALACVEEAKRLWVRVIWQNRIGYYYYRPASDDFGEPNTAAVDRDHWFSRRR